MTPAQEAVQLDQQTLQDERVSSGIYSVSKNHLHGIQPRDNLSGKYIFREIIHLSSKSNKLLRCAMFVSHIQDQLS